MKNELKLMERVTMKCYLSFPKQARANKNKTEEMKY